MARPNMVEQQMLADNDWWMTATQQQKIARKLRELHSVAASDKTPAGNFLEDLKRCVDETLEKERSAKKPSELNLIEVLAAAMCESPKK